MKRFKTIVMMILIAAIAVSTVLYAQTGVSKRNDGIRITVIADPRVNMKRIPPLKVDRGQGTALSVAAPIQINFLEAGSPDALWGDNAITWPAAASNAVVYGADLWAGMLNSPVPLTINAAWVDNLGETETVEAIVG